MRVVLLDSFKLFSQLEPSKVLSWTSDTISTQETEKRREGEREKEDISRSYESLVEKSGSRDGDTEIPNSCLKVCDGRTAGRH